MTLTKREVFGRPDQVELDIIIKNGDVILCEIKSSMSKADIYSFYLQSGLLPRTPPLFLLVAIRN
jgi:hypothetical protein